MKKAGKAPVSVLIPTKDEERNIAECIKSVSWADEIIVFDSFSSDETLRIAREMSAKIVQRRFDNFSAHKNWALDHIDFRHEWILIVDADERVTEALAAEISTLLQQPPELNGYYIARQNWFAGKWMRHGGWYPNWNLRLLRRGYGRYESRIVHEHVLLNGPAGFLKSPLINYDYKGIERYFDRQNAYSSMEAVEVYRVKSQRRGNSLPVSLTAPGPERRRLLKNLAYRYLPARPLFKFLWMYVLKLGFLHGRIGFRYCLMQMFYEYQVNLKLEELRTPGSPLYEKYRDYLQ
jgi:glycosyltransferase involved in cell wall biosynthesis